MMIETEIFQYLNRNPNAYYTFQRLNPEWKQRFLDFCNGSKTLPLTYDPFFKRIFHPDIHPGRLSRLISSLLSQEVQVLEILPAEEVMLDGGALLILDILVRLADGSIANVEVQKIPYLFPAERISCYSADLVLRQYSRVKGEYGQGFTYQNLRKVYTIVIFEKSSEELRTPDHRYLHYGKTTFDSGLDLELLQEYCLITLDEYRKNLYHIGKEGMNNEQDAWIGLLATETVEDAEKLIQQYPWLEEIYRETTDLLHNPGEVLNMYSEALRILDANTVQYMVDRQQEQIEHLTEQVGQQTEQIGQQAVQIDQQTEQIGQQAVQIDQLTKKLAEKDRIIEELTRQKH